MAMSTAQSSQLPSLSQLRDSGLTAKGKKQNDRGRVRWVFPLYMKIADCV